MEVQILDNKAEEYANLKPAQYNGGIYYQAAAHDGTAPTDEWNKYEITCRGPYVTVKLNGEVINDVDVNEFTMANGDYKPLAARPRMGYVGFQSHGSRVDFRNIELKDLTTKTESGLRYVDLKEGDGEVAQDTSTITAHYTGYLEDGTTFDNSRARGEPLTFQLSSVIKGWKEGIPGMAVGGRRKLIIPPELAYGSNGAGDVIPPDATLVFDVELLKVAP